MLSVYWATKGGVGTTVIAAATAAAATAPTLAVDLAGDLPAALGGPAGARPGVAEWMRAGDDVPADAFARLGQRLTDHLTVVGRGEGSLDGPRAGVLAGVLAGEARPVVVDGGRLDVHAAMAVADAASRSVLVTRCCYLALRRAVRLPVAPSEVVVVREPGRALRVEDVIEVVGCARVTVVDVDPVVSRAVDAGLLAGRVPRRLARRLAPVSPP